MRKPVLAGLLITAALIGLIVYSSMNLRRHRVEVCIEFNGQSRCKIASGASQEAALRTAHDNACGELAGGVTDTLACGRTEPYKVTWLK
jgi:hypothetical protein